MNKLPVSVVVITKNEEANIEDCLKSVEWAQEIVLIDDESTDKTKELARKYTDKIFARRMDNEGRHRNWASQKATHDWILSLDADERVTPALAEEIRETLKDPKFKAYGVPRQNHIGNHWLRYGGEYPAQQVKFFLKNELKYEETEVHPRQFMEGDTGYLKGDIVHYSHRDIADYLRSVNSHTTLEARKWVQTGRKMTLGHALWRAVDRCFYRRLLRKQGYRDGIFGWTVALFSGVYQVVSYLKYRELLLKQNQNGSSGTQ